MDKPNPMDEIVKARAGLIHRADQAKLEGFGQLASFLTALSLAPNTDVKIRVKSENGEEAKEGVYISVALFDGILTALLGAAERISALEALVIHGEMREHISTLESRADALLDNAKELTSIISTVNASVARLEDDSDVGVSSSRIRKVVMKMRNGGALS